jgi:hypothetical protein
MPPLFTSTSFASTARVNPQNVVGNPTGAGDPVSLTLSDGSSVQVFDNLDSALRCLEFMRQRNQWMLQASDDVTIVSVGSTKLLLLEMSLVNQRLLASFAPAYMGGQTRFLHRTMSQSLSLDDALQAVGFAKLSTAAYKGNFDLTQSPSPRILAVDWYFRSSVSTSTDGTQLNDATPISYDYTT